MDVSYRSFFSSTLTRTNATCDPSVEICGSATQTNLKMSLSVIERRCAEALTPRPTTMTTAGTIEKERRGSLLRWFIGSNNGTVLPGVRSCFLHVCSLQVTSLDVDKRKKNKT